MKIKFDLDNDLTLSKTIESHIATIVVRAIFYESKKYYPQLLLDERLYKI